MCRGSLSGRGYSDLKLLIYICSWQPNKVRVFTFIYFSHEVLTILVKRWTVLDTRESGPGLIIISYTIDNDSEIGSAISLPEKLGWAAGRKLTEPCRLGHRGGCPKSTVGDCTALKINKNSIKHSWFTVDSQNNLIGQKRVRYILTQIHIDLWLHPYIGSRR